MSLDRWRLLDSPLLRAAIDASAARGVRAWLVGGSVRDALLGRPIHDFDVAVERDAVAVARDAARRLGAPMYVLDAERDTARVVTFDAAGARVFLDFARLREPTLEGDLARRDFTVNAIALDLVRLDAPIDPFGGRRDLDARLIRAVTDDALSDDPVRMLRAARLSISLSFEIEAHTQTLIRAASHRLKASSVERLRDELAVIVGLPGLAHSLPQLDALGLLAQALPELPPLQGVTQSPPHRWDVWTHTLRLLDALEVLLARAAGIQLQTTASRSEAAPDFAWPAVECALGPLRGALRAHLDKPLSDERPAWLALKWAALYHDAAKPQTRSVDGDGRARFFGHEGIGAELIAERMQALRFSTDEIERAAAIVRHHMRPHHLMESGVSRRAAYRYFRDTGEAGVDVLLHAQADEIATRGPDLEPDGWERHLDLARSLLDAYFLRRAETVDPPPLISGHDVMRALKLKPGPHVGDILEAVREAQAAGEVKTREDALALAKSMMSETG